MHWKLRTVTGSHSEFKLRKIAPINKLKINYKQFNQIMKYNMIKTRLKGTKTGRKTFKIDQNDKGLLF